MTGDLLQDVPMERIRKLLNVTTERGASESEASFAAAKVQEILQDYGLSMAEIEKRGGGTGEDGRRGRTDADRRAMYRWQVKLMEALAENNFLMHWTEQQDKIDRQGKMRRSKQHVLLGRQINILTTLQTYDYLCETFRRLATDAGFAHGPQSEAEHHLFLGGITDRVIERLAEQRRHREREEAEKKRRDEAMRNHPAYASSGTAMVVADFYRDEMQANRDLHEDLKYGLEPGTTARKRAEAKARQAANDAAIADLVAQGIDHDVAWYMVHMNCTKEQATATVAEALARNKRYAEAMANAKVRKARPSRSRAVYRGPTQAEQREQAKRNSAAYRAGERAGDDVGLNDQITNRTTRKLS